MKNENHIEKIPLDKLVDFSRNSSFNRGNYYVTIAFHRFVSALALHVDYDLNQEFKNNNNKAENSIDFEAFLKNITPPFQRDNNKWTKKMQIKFVENLMMGAKTEILLFQMEEETDSQIIDGLQRTTAILDFYKGKIKPFGYSYEELKPYLNKFANYSLMIRVYTFEKWEEVGKFYIDMNENITHSKEDIQKAKDWFLNEKGIIL